MKRWKIIAGLSALFLCGMVVGAVFMGGMVHHLAKEFGDGEGRHPIKIMLLRNMKQRLAPDEATLAKLEADVDVSMAEMKQVRDEMKPRFDAVMNGFKDRASAYLTQEQQAALAGLMDDFKHRRRHKLKGPGWLMPMPPPPPPWDDGPPPNNE